MRSALYDDAADVGAHRRARSPSFSDERQSFEGQMVRPDSSVIDFAAMPLPDGGTLLTFADVTDSKRYERALEERNEALVAADRLKNRFIGHVSYELRTPLTNIIGFSELLASPQHRPAQRQAARIPRRHLGSSSKTLLAIIDDILDLATIDAGALELKLAPVDVRAVIDAAILGVREARRARPPDARHRRRRRRRRRSSPTRRACARSSTTCCRTPSASPSPAASIRIMLLARGRR